MATRFAINSYVRQYHRWLPDSSALETLVVLSPSMTDVDDYRGLRIPRAGEPVFIPRVFDGGYAPDGMEVATAKMAAKQIDILRGDALVRTLPIVGVYDALHTYEWSPDGRWLLIGTAKGLTLTAWTLSADGREKVHLLEKEEVEGQPLHFVPRGDGVLYLRSHSREENDLMLLPLANGRPAGESRAVIEGIQASEFTLNRDGTKLAYTRTREPSKLWLFTIAEPDSPDPDVHARRLLADASFKQSPAISPDGKRIAYTARDSQWQDLFIVPVDGGLPLRMTPSEGIKCSADWSPDGNEIAYIVQDSGGKLSMWIVSLADGRTRKLSPTPSDCSLRWVTQAMIAFPSSGNRNVGLVDPRSGAERPLLMDEGRGWAFHPVWSPDGAWVAVVWNREQTGDVKDAFKGIWVVSADGRIERPLLRGPYWPLGWSSDGQWIYAAVASSPDSVRQWSKKIFRIPFAGGDAQPWLTLPIDENVAECSMSAGARQMACVAGGESDVWMIDDFNKLLPD